MTILTFHEAAQFLRISERNLRELVRRTDIPRRQAGRKARIFFVQERLISWWDRASVPTPISVRVNTFKLLKRSRAATAPRDILGSADSKDTGDRVESELVGRIPRSPGFLPASRQD